MDWTLGYNMVLVRHSQARQESLPTSRPVTLFLDQSSPQKCLVIIIIQILTIFNILGPTIIIVMETFN